MADYPLVEKFLADKPFALNHAAHDFTLSDPNVPALEYFLSIDAVTSHGKKLCDIKSKPVGPPFRNDRLIQWASLCAEIGAICLLGETLGLEIVGLEQVSPRSPRSKANCDIVALVNGDQKYFEVKRNAAEDTQCFPEFLQQRLNQLRSEIPFGLTPELVDRNYDCTGLDEKLRRIKDHVAAFQRRKEEGLTGEAKPSTFEDEVFTVMFHEKTRNKGGWESYSPVNLEELSKKLLGPGGTGRDGKQMTPMVKQAAEQGADYLMCRVPKWDAPWTEIVKKCFADFSYSNGVTYFSKDPRLAPLEGVVLFAKYNDFCIVNNLRARTRNWLAA